ncbi:hypothetical protein KM92DES2_20086 [uncultured Desulfovibrio sp.]|uniref:Uncharacterized protein n=1 Tax=uncultured Desulfovibrio sp. TaxID=167968 RepID=A0A212KIK7_9BACT|nr:hypothetical protein KM92DES2_20086 [uncultured Desulfovibrio sp.]
MLGVYENAYALPNVRTLRHGCIFMEQARSVLQKIHAWRLRS